VESWGAGIGESGELEKRGKGEMRWGRGTQRLGGRVSRKVGNGISKVGALSCPKLGARSQDPRCVDTVVIVDRS
jgi:hypothetical protein